MDWNEQARRMVEDWIDAQSDMWQGAKGAGREPGASRPDAVEGWRTAVDQALDLQAEWVRAWSAAGEGLEGDALRDWSRQGREAMQTWLSAQRSMWEAWFDAAAGTTDEATGARRADDVWRQSMHDMVALQRAWLDAWVPAARESTEGEGTA